MKLFLNIALAGLISSVAVVPAAAQDDLSADNVTQNQTILLPPLFDYPVAPEGLDWSESSRWLVEHFWDNFDFKQKAVGQQQLIHAYYTWCVPMQYADRQTVFEAVNRLIKKLEKNPTLLLQFTRAAEYNVYSPETAQMWIDELYIPFLDALIKNKKVSDVQKARYSVQRTTLRNSTIGRPVPAFTFKTPDGDTFKFNPPKGKMAIVEFGNPLCSDCQLARIALRNDDTVSRLVDAGVLDVYFIIPDVDEDDTSWMEQMSDYSDKSWIAGAAQGLDDILDIRLSPSLYLFDASGNLLLKNIDLDRLREGLDREMENMVSAPAANSVNEQ